MYPLYRHIMEYRVGLGRDAERIVVGRWPHGAFRASSVNQDLDVQISLSTDAGLFSFFDLLVTKIDSD